MSTFKERYEERKKNRESQEATSSFKDRYMARQIESGNFDSNEITNRIDTWFKNHNNYINNYNSRYSTRKGTYEDSYVSDSGEWLDTISAQKSNFDKEASAIMSYLDQYGDYFGKEYTDSVKNAFQSALGQQSEILKQASSDKDFWSQFADENEYLGYQREYKKQKRYEGYQQKYAGMSYEDILAATNKLIGDEEKDWLKNEAVLRYDLNAAQEEIGRLTSILDVKDQISKIKQEESTLKLAVAKGDKNAAEKLAKNNQRLEALNSTWDHALSTYGSEDDLNSLLSSKSMEYTIASRAQKAAELSSVVDNDPQFSNYSELGKNISYENVGSTKKQNGATIYDDLKAATLALNEHQLGTELYNESMRTPGEGLSGYLKGLKGLSEYNTENSETVETFRKMNEREFATLAYYLKKDEENGTDLAAQYIDSIRQTLNTRVASDIAEAKEGKLLQQYAFAVGAGIDQFFEGRDAFFSGEDNIIPSATQIASGIIREDLAETGKKVEWLGGVSLGQLGYDALNTTANMLPSMLAGAVTNIALPGAGTAIGAGFLGMSAGGNAKAEMLRLGYSKEQATSYGLMVGIAEVGMEYLLGHIPGLSKGDGLFSSLGTKVASKVDNAISRVAITLGDKGTDILRKAAGRAIGAVGGALDEALEEGLQTIIELWLKEMATSVDWDAPNVDEVLYSSLLGAITSLGMGGAQNVIQDVSTSFVQNAEAKKNYGAAQRELAAKALEIDPSNKFAQRMQAKVDNGKNLTGAQLNRLVKQNNNTLTAQEGNTDTINAEKYGKMVAELDTEVSSATDSEKEKVQQVTGKLPASKADSQPDTNVGDKVAQTGEVEASEGDHIREVTKKVGETPATLKEDGKDAGVKVKEISSVKDGKITVKLDSGEVVDASEVDFGNEDTALVYQAAAEMSQRAGYNEDTVKVLVNGFESSGLNAAEYLHAFRDSFNYGAAGTVSVSALEKGKYTSLLSEKQRELAFHLGKAFGEESAQRAEQERARIENEKTASAEKEAKAVKASGEVIFDGSVNQGSLSKAQKAQIKVLQGVSSAIGAKIRLFASEATVTEDGRRTRVFSSADGEAITANGWYDNETGEIWIDVNAGVDGNGLILFTAAHELTHFIKDWSSEKYNAFANFLISQYAENGVSVDELIEAQIEKAAKRGREMTREEAFDEVVADSCESFLTDSNAAEKIAALNEKDATLAEKIKSYIHKLLVKIRNLLKGIDPDSEEGKIVRGMTDSLEQLYELWTDALADAGQNYQKGDVRNQKGKMQRSERDSKAYDYTKPFYEQVEDYINGKFPTGDSLVLGATPEVFQKIGFNALPMTINQKHVDYALNGTKNFDHEIGESLLKNLPTALSHPIAIITSKTEGDTSVVAILSITHNGKPVNAPVYIDGFGKQNGIRIDSNAVTSVYARQNAVTTLLKNALIDETNNQIGVFYWDKKTALTLLSGGKVTMPNVPNTLSDGYVHSIREKSSPVKPKLENVTESQQFLRWFGDWQRYPNKASKIVNEDGTPKIMYHGTKANFTVFDQKKAKASGLYGKGFYFTDSKSHSASYGDAMAVYLNIRNPLSPASDTVTKSQIRNFLSAVAENEDYSIENYGTYDIEEILTKITSRDAFAVIQDINATAIGDFVEAIKLFNSVNSTQYDGIVVPTETVAFYPEQIKSANDNIGTFDSKNPDIRYSERDSDAISSREVLANALESTVQNDIEAERLAEYKSKIEKFDAEEQKLRQLRAEIKELSFTPGKRDNARLAELRAEAEKTANRINIYDKQLLRLEASKPLEGILQREKQKAYKKAKADAAEKMNDMRAVGVREKIKKIKAEIERELQRPTDRTYIPTPLGRAMIEVCSLIDTDTPLIKKNGTVNRAQEKREKTKERLSELAAEYENLKNNDDYMLVKEHDAQIDAYLKQLRNEFDDVSIKDMSLDQLREFHDILRSIVGTLRDARKVIGKNDAKSLYEYGNDIISEQKKIGEKRGERSNFQKQRDKRLNLSLSPMRNIERMSGYNPDSALVEITRDFEEGVRKKNFWEMGARKSFDSLITGKNEKNYQDSIYKEFGKEYTDSKGRKFRVSKMQMMQAILSYEREISNAGKKHIEKGGLTFADLKLLEQGKIADAVSGENAHNVPNAAYLVADFISALANDKWAQDYMATAREFFNKTAKDAINDTYLRLKHRIIARDKNYIPYEVDKTQVVRDITNMDSLQQTINSYGILQDTQKNAPQALIITGLNNMVDRHIDQVGSVYGLAIPVRNFNKIWNIRESAIDGGEGKPITVVQGVIEENWGADGKKFIEQMVTDLQGARKNTRSELERKIESGYIGATFALNLSVVMKQIGSLYTANSELDRSRTGVGMLTNLAYTMAHFDKLAAEVDKYTAAIYNRRQGLSDNEVHTFITQAKKSGISRALNKLPAGINPTKWITFMDASVALSLWKYVKADVAKNTKLKGEELLKETAKRFDSLIENTQSMSDVLHKPEIQKRQDVFSKSFAMFKTDLYQSAGQLRVMAGRYQANKSDANKKALTRTVVSIARSAAWNSLMTTLFALLRYKVNPYRDDEEELTPESWLKRQGVMLAGDFAGYLFPIFGSEIVGLIENVIYGESEEAVDSLALTLVNDLVDSITTIGNAITEGEMPDASEWENLLMKSAQFLGIPLSNIKRTVKAIKLHAEDIANGEFLSFEAGANKTDAKQLYDAVISGNDKRIEKAEALFDDQKAIDSALRKGLRENDVRIKAAARMLNSGDIRGFAGSIETISGEGIFDGETVEAAIRAEASAFNSKIKDAAEAKRDGKTDDYIKIVKELRESYRGVYTQDEIVEAVNSYTFEDVVEDDVEEVESVYKNSDINAALESGDTETAGEIIKELIEVKTENNFLKAQREAEESGKRFKEKEARTSAELDARSSIRSSLTNYWKKRYIAAYESGNEAEVNRISELLYSTGIYGNRKKYLDEVLEGWLEK